MPEEREHRMIQLDDAPFEQPDETQHTLDPAQGWPPADGAIAERVARNRVRDEHMQQLLMQHVIQAGVINCRIPFMRRLQVGHEVMLVKERRIVTIVGRFEQEVRQRDWGKIRFQDDRQEVHEWIISDKGKGLDDRQLMLPVMRLHQLLEMMQRQADEMAQNTMELRRTVLDEIDTQIIRDLNAAMQHDGEAQPGGITRADLAAAARLPHESAGSPATSD